MNDHIFYIKEVAAFISIVGSLILIFRRRKAIRLKREGEKDLSTFFEDDKEVYDYQENFIKTQGVDRPPDEEDEPKESYEAANRKELIKFFMNQVFTSTSKKMYLVMAGAGMGKTTFLINLFLAYNSKFRKKEYNIRYVPLGDPEADNFIELYKDDGKNKDGGNTILLLDAFDEDPKATDDYESRINEIALKTRTFRKVIVTSRTQFFPEEEKEKFSITLPKHGRRGGQRKFIKKYIAPFTEEEIRRFLRKKYGTKYKIFGETFYKNYDRKKAEEIVEMASNLVVRPMLLDNIDLLLLSNRIYFYEYEVYEEFIKVWLMREGKKQPHRTNDNFMEEMHSFIYEAARSVYRNFQNGEGLFIEESILHEMAENKSILLNKIDLSTRSLLNRNTKGRLKFSHKSILEYLLAKTDSESYATKKIIDFDFFDFGRQMRNQIVYNSFTGSFQQVFAFRKKTGNSDYYLPLNKKSYKKELATESILVSNYTEIEIRKFRLFNNLKEMFVLSQTNLYNIKKIVKSKKMLRASTNDIYYDFEIHLKNTKSIIRATLKRYVEDDFFEQNGINVYWIEPTKK